MSKLELNEELTEIDHIDLVKIRNHFAVYSTLRNDPIFHKSGGFNEPIFCGGRILATNQNVYNYFYKDQIVYISYGQVLNFETTSQLLLKIPNDKNYKLISIIPYASYAMKILRHVNPKIGHKILIIGLNLISLLLQKLFSFAGASVYILDLEENFQDYSTPKDDRILSKMEDFSQKYDNLRLDSIISFSNKYQNIKLLIQELNYDHFYQTDQIPPYDKGFDDILYNKGIKYPYSYVRWDYKRNLKYFISLVMDNIISLDFFKLSFLEVDSIDKIFKEINIINTNSLILYKII